VSEPNRHHYIPVFYLKQWTGSDGRLCEYSRPHEVVRAKRKHPSATGYVDGLYSLPDAPPEQVQRIEKQLMRSVDDWAAKALSALLQDGPAPAQLDPRLALGWCRFLYSLIVRNPEHLELARQKMASLGPENLESIREDYPTLRTPADPVTFDEYKAKFALNPISIAAPTALPYLINSRRVARELASFIWITRPVLSAKRTILTSDRPIIMTNGLARSDAHIVIPISPRVLFIASRNEKTNDSINSMTTDEIVETTNNKVAEQAIKYVYGVDDTQLRFVANRLGKKVRSSPLEPPTNRATCQHPASARQAE